MSIEQHKVEESQSYKIYINEKPIWLIASEKLDDHVPIGRDTLIAPYHKKKSLLQYIDTLEKNSRIKEIIVHAPNVEKLWRDFLSLYELIEAAGGLVDSGNGEVFFIYRRGHWDIPKGKLDPGETLEQAAIREVFEETKLSPLDLKGFLGVSYHCYRNKKGTRMLKKSSWFVMETPTREYELEKSEGITDGEWLKPTDFLRTKDKIYASIVDVVHAYMEKRVEFFPK